MNLENRVAIITGAKSGIGLAVAKRFAAERAKVVLADIIDASAEAEEIRKERRDAIFVQTDVSLAGKAEALFREALKRFGRLDILVNNAGVELAKKVTETSEEEWDHVMNINLKGVFLCSKAAIPLMKRRGGGVIVNVASELGLVGGEEIAAYCASAGQCSDALCPDAQFFHQQLLGKIHSRR